MNPIRKFLFFLQRIFRLSLNYEKQLEVVWEDLKKMHNSKGWRSGVYENERYIETVFKIDEDQLATFNYIIHDGYFYCRVKVLDYYPPEMTTDCFVLAAHFNNLLNHGMVVLDPESQNVVYSLKHDHLVPLLYTGEAMRQILNHHETARDVYKAFRRLLIEQEAPAVIIGDLINEKRKENNQSEEDSQ